MQKRIILLAIVILLLFGMGQLPLLFAEEEGGRRHRQALQEVFQIEVVYPQEKGEVQI